jgi:hypothetical protein
VHHVPGHISMTVAPGLDRSTADYVREQFEAFQLDDDGISHGPGMGGASRRAAAVIKKHVQVAVLHRGMASLSVSEDDDDDDDNDAVAATTPSDPVASLVTPILLRYVDAALTMEPQVEAKDAIARVLDLVAALACDLSGDVVDAVLDRATTFSAVLSERIRSQACSLLGYLAYHLRLVLLHGTTIGSRPKNKNIADGNADADWAVRRLEMVEGALVPRLTDKSQMVRQSAIQGGGVLLSVTNGDLGIGSSENDVKPEGGSTKFVKALDGLLWALWHDPSVANRVEALNAVPIKDTVDHVISRIRDVKEKVRVTALDVLRLKVDPREMTEEQFCEIIQHGLTER